MKFLLIFGIIFVVMWFVARAMVNSDNNDPWG
jgi:hypothetical protein